MIERLPCGCVSNDRSFLPTPKHPQLGMCPLHKAAWAEIQERAALEHEATQREARRP